MKSNSSESWRERFGEDLTILEPIIQSLHLNLDADQPHLSGERFLMTRNKLVLAGVDKNGVRVIIKAADHLDGKKEIDREKNARDLLASLSFTSDAILFPKEIYYGEKKGYLFLVTQYIPQDKVFVAHTLEEQFFMALRAFEAQEAFHATTFEHLKTIEIVFPVKHAKDYFSEFKTFITTVEKTEPDSVAREVLEQALDFLESHKQTIDTYCNHLVHTDFVPHNFRVESNKLYMLDAAAVEFGNKYEGWARFQNYMTIHNPDLEKLLSEYIVRNRGEKEYLNLRLMRVFKIGYLIEYYVRSLPKTEGDLHDLTRKRIAFWHRVMESVLDDTPLPPDVVENYVNKRDILRSDEEKKRQKEFAVS